MSTTQLSPEMEALKGRLRSTWMAGDFGVIARSIEKAGEDFVSWLGIKAGMKVLDVACGTGNLAIPAAKLGADVSGIDIASNLIDQARARAASEGVPGSFEVSDAEDMPYSDNTFDVVMSMYGAMFAPRPEVTANEMLRVCKPGGTVGMANWTPEGFIGKMFKIGSKHVPPPAGMPAPILWGNEDTVRQRFGSGASDLEMERVKCIFVFDMSPAEVVEHFRLYFGPTQKAFEKLDADGQAALRAELVELWSSNNRANNGTTEVEAEYLDVRAIKA